MKKLIIVILLFSINLAGCNRIDQKFTKDPASWETRNTYKTKDIEFSLMNTYFTAGKVNKYAWIFQDNMNNYKGKKMKVVGVSKESNAELILLENVDMYVENGDNKPERTIVPSGFMIPQKGIWRLNVYVDGKLLGNVVVEVKGDGV